MTKKKCVCLITVAILEFFLILYPVCTDASSFSKDIPGIDVSIWQRNINFSKVKESGIQAVYIRACYGSSRVDPYFRSNYGNAKSVGLKLGFYHYVTAKNVDEARQQANFFYSLIKDKKMQCRPAMDFERFPNLSDEEINEIALTYIETLEDLLGYQPVVYSNEYTVKTIWSKELAKYPLWIAHYYVDEPRTTGHWDKLSCFQYSDNGKIDGISGRVDLDYFQEDIFITKVSVPKPVHKIPTLKSNTTPTLNEHTKEPRHHGKEKKNSIPALMEEIPQ